MMFVIMLSASVHWSALKKVLKANLSEYPSQVSTPFLIKYNSTIWISTLAPKLLSNFRFEIYSIHIGSTKLIVLQRKSCWLSTKNSWKRLKGDRVLVLYRYWSKNWNGESHGCWDSSNICLSVKYYSSSNTWAVPLAISF